MPTETAIPAPKFGTKKVYSTTYKKGQMLGHFHFESDGDLATATEEVRQYLEKINLRHVQTMPFLVDLKSENNRISGRFDNP